MSDVTSISMMESSDDEMKFRFYRRYMPNPELYLVSVPVECRNAEEIQTHPTFVSIEIVILCLDFTGILVSAYVAYLVATLRALTNNLRILLINLLVALFLTSVTSLAQTAERVIRIFTYESICDLMHHTLSCSVYYAILSVAVFAVLGTHIGAMLERIYSLFFRIEFQGGDDPKKPVFAYFFVPLTWILLVHRFYSIFFSNDVDYLYSNFTSYCSLLSTVQALGVFAIYSFATPIMVLVIIINFSTYYISYHRYKEYKQEKRLQDYQFLDYLCMESESSKCVSLLSLAYSIHVTIRSYTFYMKSTYILDNRYEVNVALWVEFSRAFYMPLYINVHSVLVILLCKRCRDRTTSMLLKIARWR